MTAANYSEPAARWEQTILKQMKVLAKKTFCIDVKSRARKAKSAYFGFNVWKTIFKMN